MFESKEIDLKTQFEKEDITYDNQHSTEDKSTDERQELNSAENSERIEKERQQSILNSQPIFKRNMIKEGKSSRSSYYNTLIQKGLLNKNK